MTPEKAKERMAEIRSRILNGNVTWYSQDEEWTRCQKILDREASKKKPKKQRKELRRLAPEEA